MILRFTPFLYQLALPIASPLSAHPHALHGTANYRAYLRVSVMDWQLQNKAQLRRPMAVSVDQASPSIGGTAQRRRPYRDHVIQLPLASCHILGSFRENGTIWPCHVPASLVSPFSKRHHHYLLRPRIVAPLAIAVLRPSSTCTRAIFSFSNKFTPSPLGL